MEGFDSQHWLQNQARFKHEEQQRLLSFVWGTQGTTFLRVQKTCRNGKKTTGVKETLGNSGGLKTLKVEGYTSQGTCFFMVKLFILGCPRKLGSMVRISGL